MLAALTATCCRVAIADAPPDAASFFKEPATSLVSLSPQGHYVALMIVQENGRQALAVRDTADLKKLTVPVTADSNAKIIAVHWINENRIGFTFKNYRTESESNLDEFAVDRDGSNLIRLISGNWRHQQEVLGSNIKDKVLTADYAFFDVTHDGSDDILIEKYSWNSVDIHPDASRLYRLDTRTRRLRDVIEGAQPEHSQQWLPDANDTPRIVTAQSQGRCVTYYRAKAGDRWDEMVNIDCEHDDAFSPLFFDGADTLYVQSNHQGYNALFRYDVKAMKMAKEPFLSVPGFDFRGAPVLDYASKRLLGIRLEGDAYTTIWLDPRLKALQKKVDALLPQTTNTIECAADCLNAPVVLVKSSSDGQPLEYFIYTQASGAIIGLGGAHPDIQPQQMGQRDFYHYAARDGMSIPVYVTQPPGKAKGPLPTVVLVHGGPGVRGGFWEWDQEAQFLATRGYLVIQADYRGSSGFGYRHYQAGWKQWGLGMQDDLADAALWAVKQGWADPKRVAIMGASYGGYATLMGLIKNPEIFRCGVDWAGVTDLNLMFTTAEDDASQESLQYGMRTLIGDPAKDAAMFVQNSPLPNADRLRQPLLIAHGAQDQRVPLIHATKFRDAVEKNNPHVEWLVYAEEGHGWRHEEDSIDFWKHVEVFLDKNLKQAQ